MKETRQIMNVSQSCKWGVWLVISNCITFQMALMYISKRDLTTTTPGDIWSFTGMPVVVTSHSHNNVSATNDGNNVPPDSITTTRDSVSSNLLAMGVVDPVRELFDWLHPNRLKTIAQRHKLDYARAKPYPHMVLDGLFPNSILQAVEQEIPEKNIKRDGCMKKNSYCAKSKTDFKKSSIQYEKRMSYYTRTMFAALKSSAFTKFLEELTGVQGILPDPHFEGSGIHVTSAGGHLNIHADFNWYNKLRLDRRVNVLLFLNPDWDESYGGHLELWSKDMKSCMQRVLPTLGRLFPLLLEFQT